MAKQTTLKQKVALIFEREGLDDDEYRWREGYSGRGMNGRESKVALVTWFSPDSIIGKALQRLGLRYDSMGKGYIYYSR